MAIDTQWGVTADLIAYMGESWELDVRVYDRNGAPVDLAAALEVRLQIKAHPDQTLPDYEIFTGQGITIKGMEDDPAPFAVAIELNATVEELEEVIGTEDDATEEIVDQDAGSQVAVSTRNIIGIRHPMSLQTAMTYSYDIRVQLDTTRYFYPLKGTIEINQNVTR